MDLIIGSYMYGCVLAVGSGLLMIKSPNKLFQSAVAAHVIAVGGLGIYLLLTISQGIPDELYITLGSICALFVGVSDKQSKHLVVPAFGSVAQLGTTSRAPLNPELGAL